jgi:hypothetical protein
MSFIRWYITKVKNIDPDMVHPSIWGKSTREFNELDETKKKDLKNEWRMFTFGDLEEKKELRAPVENRTSPLMFEGQEIPGDISSMDEVKMFLDLPKRERERMLESWRNRDSSPQTLSSPVEAISGVQIPLFRSSKVKVLLDALRKYSNVR